MFVALSLCAYGSKLNGTYATQSADMSLTFKWNGKVTVAVMSREFEGNYTVDGNKIRLTIPERPQDGTQVLTLREDGSIEGPFGIMTKQKK